MLKKLLFIGAFFILGATAYAQKTDDKAVTVSGPKFSLTNRDTVFDFCEIEENDIVKHEFLFQNTGNEPLFINNVYSKVGNASFKWPSRIIKPGKTGIIRVTYSSFMDVGPVAGDIYVNSNATKEPIAPLHIKGKVLIYDDCDEPCDKKSAKK